MANTLLQKLKDGVQETVVFLRMLEQFKIPAVMETRRKKLMEKLLFLQGDTIRETPPSYENGEGPAGGGPTSPVREDKVFTRKGSVVEDKVSAYARIETKAQQQMQQGTPKKKATSPPPTSPPPTSPPPRPSSIAEKPENEPAGYLEPSSAVVQRREKDKDISESPDRRGSTISAASNEDAMDGKKPEEDEISVKESGGKKKRFGTGLKGLKRKFGGLSKKSTTSVEQAPQQNGSQEGEPAAAVATETEEGDTVAAAASAEPQVEGEGEGEGEAGEEEVEELEEGVRIKSELEKRVQKRFGSGFNWAKISGTLKGCTLTLTTGNKEKQLELVGCTVSPSDAAPNGIELFSHTEQKQWVFRVESEQLRESWVRELQAAIDECPTEPRPPVQEPLETSIEDDKQEKPLEEEIPEIKVEPAEGEEEMAPKKKRTSFAVSPSRSRTKAKPLNEIPDQGIQMKGYVHRKKGTFGGWERTYCVVTFTAMYFTTGEDVREYHHMCMFDGVGSVKREKKGHDKQSESLFVKSGKNKETLSLAAGELQTWFSSLEEVLGVAQVNLELGSEDEDDGTPAPPAPAAAAVPIIEDDLYEELPAGDDFGIEEDIYEEFDDVPRVKPTPIPSLPQRNEPKAYQPGPVLPPRNEITAPLEPSPTLPPRNSPNPTPKFPHTGPTARVLKSAPQPPPPDVGGEELYEDIVSPQGAAVKDEGGEELYEDVVAPQQALEEELYDDVAGGGNGPVSPTEDYVVMERGQGENEQEVYCEMDSDTPPHAPINSLTLPPKEVNTTAHKIQKPAPPASYIPKHSGSLSHKPPKKSRFYEEWAAVEGTDLCTYKNQKDKRTLEKLPLSEFDMHFGPAQAGKFAFRLSKGDKVHHFNLASKEALSGWVAALRGSAKTAMLELPPGEQQVYQATQDHIADSDEQISFKAGAYIRVINQDSADFWIGQLGNDSQLFSGKIGKFPTSKVTIAEDLYI